MATYDEVAVWVNPAAWDDPAAAEQAIDAILASGSDDETDWVQLAGGGPRDILEAAARDFDRVADTHRHARAEYEQRIRAAYKAGVRKVDIVRVTGLSRPTVDAILARGVKFTASDDES